MKAKILLVGYCPSHRGFPSRPLDGPGTGHRLARLCGLTNDEYLKTFAKVNLHYFTPKKRNKTTKEEGRLNANLIRQQYKGRRIILLGREVLTAFSQVSILGGWLSYPRPIIAHFLKSGDGTQIAFIPHPSGLNRWYNNKKNLRQVKKFLRVEVAKSQSSR